MSDAVYALTVLAPVCPVCVVQVHDKFKVVQTEMARYIDECNAASSFFSNSSVLMTQHLKNTLMQVGDGQADGGESRVLHSNL